MGLSWLGIYYCQHGEYTSEYGGYSDDCLLCDIDKLKEENIKLKNQIELKIIERFHDSYQSPQQFY